MHWQSQSYAEHEALGGYYTAIDSLVDDLVEQYQSKYGIMTGYKATEFGDITTVTPVAYLENLLKYIDQTKDSIFDDSSMLNLVDEIKGLLQKTLYKLKNLK